MVSGGKTFWWRWVTREGGRIRQIEQSLIHQPPPGKKLACGSDALTISNDRRLPGQVRPENHLMTLRDMLTQPYVVLKFGSGRKPAIVCHNGNIVAGCIFMGTASTVGPSLLVLNIFHPDQFQQRQAA